MAVLRDTEKKLSQFKKTRLAFSLAILNITINLLVTATPPSQPAGWEKEFDDVICGLGDAMTAVMVLRQEEAKLMQGFKFQQAAHPADIAHEEVEKVRLFIRSLLAREKAEARMGSRLPKEMQGDGPCNDCGTVDNPVWFTDNVFWNDVVRTEGPDKVLCVNCFVIRAEKKYKVTGWRLLPDWNWQAARAACGEEGVV